MAPDPHSTPALLEVKDLRVSFGGKEVVHGIDFSIAPGEKLALVGESGSGKTVTALSLLRLVQNAELGGRALFAAREVTSDGAQGERSICWPCPNASCAGSGAATSP
jgi:microcin C transport system ATP-binding protein